METWCVAWKRGERHLPVCFPIWRTGTSTPSTQLRYNLCNPKHVLTLTISNVYTFHRPLKLYLNILLLFSLKYTYTYKRKSKCKKNLFSDAGVQMKYCETQCYNVKLNTHFFNSEKNNSVTSALFSTAYNFLTRQI